MKRTKFFAKLMGVAFMASMFGLTSCADDNDSSNGNSDDNTSTDVADYTFIMYAAGGGDLDASIIDEIYSNYQGFGDKVKLAGLYKPSKSLQESSKTNGLDGTRYFEAKLNKDASEATIKKHIEELEAEGKTIATITDDKAKQAAMEKLTTHVYQDFCLDFVNEKYAESSFDMSNPDNIAAAIKEVAKRNPAKKYILVTDNHGGGWRVYDDTAITSRAQVFDDNNDYKGINLDNLNSGVQKSGITFEALFCDLCLMAYIENLTGYQQNFKFCIASAETTTSSMIGTLGLRLAKAGASISDDELFNQLSTWVKNDEYKKDWDTFSAMASNPVTDCQDMGVYDLRKINTVTSVMKDIATWYTTAYDNADYQKIINAAVLTSNYVIIPSLETIDTSIGFYTARKTFLDKLGMSQDDIVKMIAYNNQRDELYNAIQNSSNDLDFMARNMSFGITFSHFVRTTVELMKAAGYNNADLTKLSSLYDSYQSALKNMCYIKCSHSDFSGMDAYVWTSPTITLHTLNADYFTTEKTPLVVFASAKCTLNQAIAAYNNTAFDQQTGWSNFLKKLTVSPCVLTNPIRSTAMYDKLASK